MTAQRLVLSDCPPPDWKERLAVRVVESLSKSSKGDAPLAELLRAFTEGTGLQQVNLRLKAGDDFPMLDLAGGSHASTHDPRSLLARGPDGSLLLAEDGRPLLMGCCGALIRGDRSWAPDSMTERGSFFTGHLSAHPALIVQSLLEGTALASATGALETLALIPLSDGHETVGLLMLGDARPLALSSGDVEILERLAGSIRIALQARKLEDTLEDSEAAKRALRSSEDRFSKFFRSSPAAVAIVRASDLVFLEINEAFQRVFGYRRDDLIGRTALELGFWVDLEERQRLRQKLLAEHRFNCEEVQLRTKNGGSLTLLCSAELIELAGEDQIICTAEDITEQKRGKIELLASELLYRRLVDLCPDAILVHRKGLVTLVNRAAQALLGATRPEELLGRQIRELVHPDDWQKVSERVRGIVEEGKHAPLVPERLIRVDGKEILAEVAGAPVQLPDGIVVQVIARDLTERQRSAELVELLERSIDAAPDAVVWLDQAGRVVHVNDGACRAFGYTTAELLGKHIFDLNPRATPEYWAKHWAEIRRTKTHRTETTHRRKDGTEYPAEISAAFVNVGGQELICGFAHDISERKASEEALRESERRLRTVTEGAPDTILQVDRQGVINFINRPVPGLTVEQVIGTTVFDWVPPEQHPILSQSIKVAFATGHRQHYESLGPGPNGVQRLYSVRVLPVGGTPAAQTAIYTATDITDQRHAEEERGKLQAQLFQAQKMEAIGTLAGGVAHDFNNLLGGILAGLSLIDLKLGERFEFHAELMEMQALVERGADLTKQLLGFARRGKYVAAPVDLTAALEATCRMFGRTRKDITVNLSCAPELAPVLADRTQIEQVLLNLFLNAGQAMPKGGTLSVRAENAVLSAGVTTPHGTMPGPYVRVSVSDTGIGMDAATRQRVFEPFFTTREIGQGTGLGLASVFGITQNHGGFVTVDSEPGRGSTFSVFLPASDRHAAEDVGPSVAPRRGGETILIVDDEDQIRRTCGRLLEAMGYEVLVAESGQKAIEIFREHRSRIALVILDMIMPGMSGGQTFDVLRAADPSLKILLSSGYSVEGQATEILQRGCNGFLQKPFDMATLSAKLRELL